MGSEGFLTVSGEYETHLCENSSQLLSLQGKDLSENVASGKDKSCPEVEEGMSLQQITTKVSQSGSSCSKRPRMSESQKSTGLSKLEESRDVSEKLGSDHIKSISPNIFCPRKQALFSSYLYVHNPFSLIFFWYREKRISKAKEPFYQVRREKEH
ncbi:hypothetical protein ACSQ67_003737 [Phaseolus vulgaris]